MAEPEQQHTEKPYDKNREGARWVNRKPSGPEFAAWFKDNVRMPEGLEHEHYVGGIVLIPAKENVDYVQRIKDDGEAIIARRAQLTYTPYPKVETRLECFWDLLDENDEKWYAIVEPIETTRPSTEPVTVKEQVMDGDRLVERETQRVPTIVQTVEQLPKGFFVMSVPVGGEIAHYLCCSYLVEIREREGDRLRRSGRGTKAVPLVTTKTWNNVTTIKPDDNAIMKAETGAKGRALGFAGILNIPGSGVATAEDMIEALTGPAAGVQPDEPQTPPEQAGPDTPAAEPAPQKSAAEQQADEHKEMVARARALVEEGANYPGVLDEFREWGQKRNPPVRNLGNLRGAALRGAIKKLEKLVEAGKARAAEQGDTPPPEPTETPTPEPEEPPADAGHPAPQPDEGAPQASGEPPAEAGDAHAEPGGS